jgi:hypothetical protein
LIITRLMGGLGNQMFQYALGRSLALRHGVELKVDLDFLRHEQFKTPDTTPYEYALRRLRIEAAVASDEECLRLRQPPVRGWRRQLRKARVALTPRSRRSHIVERGLEFDPAVLQTGPRAYLEGYWQSPRYFEACADRIRADLEPCDPPDEANAGLLAQIARGPAVAVHVRRGDYLTNPGAARVHGVCGLDYYAAALGLLAPRAPGARYFLFSNDPDWVAGNLRVPGPATVVSHNGDRPWEDIRLMRACTHFVIANSSFSWWGAWLAHAPGKIVVAPRRWGLAPGLNVATRHPPDWITV